MIAQLDTLTPFSPEITIRKAAQMGRVSVKDLAAFVGSMMSEEWTDPDHHMPAVMAAAAVAVVKMNREADKLARTIQTPLGPLVRKPGRTQVACWPPL